MTAPAREPMTIADFLAWTERHEEGRYELVDGEIIPLPREPSEHVAAKGKIWRVIAQALVRAGNPARPMPAAWASQWTPITSMSRTFW